MTIRLAIQQSGRTNTTDMSALPDRGVPEIRGLGHVKGKLAWWAAREELELLTFASP